MDEETVEKAQGEILDAIREGIDAVRSVIEEARTGQDPVNKRAEGLLYASRSLHNFDRMISDIVFVQTDEG